MRFLVYFPYENIEFLGSLSLTFPGYSLPNPTMPPSFTAIQSSHQQQIAAGSQKEPCTIRLQLFMCPERFRIAARLNYCV
jgi:hypothetical protein